MNKILQDDIIKEHYLRDLNKPGGRSKRGLIRRCGLDVLIKIIIQIFLDLNKNI